MFKRLFLLTSFVLALSLVCTASGQQTDPHNVAMKGTATVSSTGYGWTPDRAIDGNVDTGSHSADDDPDKWLEVELDQVYTLNEIAVVNRDSCCWERMATVVVKALDADRNEIYVSDPIDANDALQGSVHTYDNDGAGFADVRYIRLEGGTNFLQIMEVRAMITWPYAWAPIPADGAIEVDTTSLEWTAGDTAVSHKVYLSTDETIDESDLAAETEMAMHFVTLDPGATYYWRVDEVDADGNVVEGDVWSFSTLPLEAHFPSPPDGASNAISVELSWTPGKNAIMHNVSFGTDPAALLPVSMMQMDTSYDPGPLEPATTYYWKVDEFAGITTNLGPVWSFSTIGAVTPSGIPDLIAQYEFEEDAGSLAALDTSGNDHHGLLLGDASIAGGVLSLDGSGDAVDAGSDPAFHPAGAFSVSAYVNMTGWGGGWQNVIVGTRGESGLGWQLRRHSGNTNLTFTVRGTPGADDPRGTIVPPLNEWIHVAAVFDPDGGTRAVYINGVLDVQIGDSGTVAVSDHNLFIGARASGGNTPEGFFNGDIDYVLIYNRALTVEDIRSLAGIEALPWSPDPADGAEDVPDSVVLSWRAGEAAILHDVYLGTDADAVAAADATDTTGIYRGQQVETTYAPLDLSWDMTYYWRVDQFTVDGATTCITTGPVWSFAVPDYIVIETQETTLDYDNSVEPFVSEAAWDTPADLTVEGVSDLTLRFLGAPAPEGRGSSSIDEATGTYTITGAGADIWGSSDQFHYGYVQITGDATITARVVDNGTGSNAWAKGGVMIRQDNTAPSAFAFMAVTGGSGGGAAFQWRDANGAGAGWPGDHTSGVTPPQWVRLVREGNSFTSYLSTDGVTWEASPTEPHTVEMTGTVLVGLAVTSHASGELRTFTFDNVDIVGNIISGIESRDIGIAGNSAEPIYVALEDSAGVVGVVTHPDPAATQINQWWMWKIPLSDFSDAGVDLTAAAKLYFGVGDGEPGSYGSIRIDDIKVIKPAGGANIIWVSFHGADDVPSSGAAGDGFTEAPDKEYTDLLTGNGYNVMRYITTSSPDPEVLNAADLVITSRSVASSGYQNDGATAWNSITAPMIITGGYTTRSSRMGFTTGGTMVDTTGDITLTVNDPAHPIFAGIELIDGTMVNPFAGVVTYPTDGTTVARGISVNNNDLNAEGTLLATVSNIDDPTVGGMVIAEWQAGATLTHSGGAGTDILAGPRLVFLTGAREASGISSETSGLYDLYADGAQMFLNAVNYMIPVKDVTAPGDNVKGVPDDGDWPGAESPPLAIDDNTGTKYLHRKGGSMATGFVVTPLAGASIVTGLTLTTANDSPGRDPIAFELSGSNVSIDGPYELIASGDVVDFALEAEWPRFTMNETPISFDNDVAYDHYKIVFPILRGPTDSLMQIAEVELLGVLAP